MSAVSNPEIVFTAPRSVEIRDAGVPELGAREIRVRARRTLISAGTEGASYAGREWRRADGTVMPHYPTVPGYSSAGVIVEAGPEVEDLAVGDRVATAAPHRLLSAVSVDSECLWRIPEAVTDEQATLCVLGCTVLNGVRLGHPQLGESAAVIGLGVLGQLVCRYLSLTGAARVIGIDLDDDRLELASGAVTDALNPSGCDVGGRVRELTGGRGADVVFEVTGLTGTFTTAFDLARRFGTVVALGSPRWPDEVDMMPMHLKALTCVGAIVSSHPRPGDERNRWSRPANGRLFLRLVADGSLDIDAMFTHRLSYADAADAYPLAIGEREPCLGVVLRWPEED